MCTPASSPRIIKSCITAAEYLVGQMYPDVVFPNNGMTGAEHHAHATAFLRRC